MSGERLEQRGELVGHSGWVTALATTPEDPELLLSASRDKTILVWQLTREEGNYGFAVKSLVGHSHFVEDVVISSDGQFCLSASWDGTLRLWDIKSGETERRFVGHTKEVLSVAFSADNRQIVSGSRDKTIKLWNTLGECKFTVTDKGHTEWVSCVRFSPSTTTPLIVSCGCFSRRARVPSGMSVEGRSPTVAAPFRVSGGFWGCSSWFNLRRLE